MAAIIDAQTSSSSSSPDDPTTGVGTRLSPVGVEVCHDVTLVAAATVTTSSNSRPCRLPLRPVGGSGLQPRDIHNVSMHRQTSTASARDSLMSSMMSSVVTGDQFIEPDVGHQLATAAPRDYSYDSSASVAVNQHPDLSDGLTQMTSLTADSSMSSGWPHAARRQNDLRRVDEGFKRPGCYYSNNNNNDNNYNNNSYTNTSRNGKSRFHQRSERFIESDSSPFSATRRKPLSLGRQCEGSDEVDTTIVTGEIGRGRDAGLDASTDSLLSSSDIVPLHQYPSKFAMTSHHSRKYRQQMHVRYRDDSLESFDCGSTPTPLEPSPASATSGVGDDSMTSSFGSGGYEAQRPPHYQVQQFPQQQQQQQLLQPQLHQQQLLPTAVSATTAKKKLSVSCIVADLFGLVRRVRKMRMTSSAQSRGDALGSSSSHETHV